MLTIKELDILKQNKNNLYHHSCSGCWSDDACLYAYDTGVIYLYWECERCLKADQKALKNTTITKLSLKEQFYLKI